jgi:SAM-dependent methyltransferase
VIPDVVGIDIAPASISLARQRHSARAIDFVRGDFLTYPFRDCSFDLITCSAAMHHMPLKRALRRMADLLRPGGVLAILGLARSSYPLDLPRDAVAVAVNRVFLVMRGYWDSPAPAVPPRAPSYREIRAVAAELLPGHRFRRHLLWRYSIIWTKPPGVASA